MRNLKNLTLEVSLKPFNDTSHDGMERKAREIFTQWSTLIQHADTISIMLWTADGSEILDYRGELDDVFDWARYIGCCNGMNGPLHSQTDDDTSTLNNGYYLYMENPPVYTYRILKQLVSIIRRTGEEMTGKPVRVGETFDPGPEFADSSFKYERHPEINTSYPSRGREWFLCSYSRLHADKHIYAGYPNGIPESTPIGEFLGRQSRYFLTDMGFDFLWLSNGLGFGLEPWKCTGEIFDGKAFHPEKAEKARKDITDFWSQFRKECPEIRLEVRGTNMGVGIDIATDGVSFKDIYNGGYNIKPPPNSPWAALDGDFGLELTGYMSRIAELPPGEGYPFRFYSHDPWWMNSPWIDRYEGQPHDIYMPSAISRIDKDGKVLHSDSLYFLTIDNSLGEMPECVPNEITPHMIRAYTNAPDAASPLLWVYPFDEYDDLGKSGLCLGKMYSEDWFIRGTVNHGLPLSGVVSTSNFLSSLEKISSLYNGSILMTPVPKAGSLLEKSLCSYVEKGGQVLLYGALALAGKRLLSLLGLSCSGPISGECVLYTDTLSLDSVDIPCSREFRHDPLLSDGGLCAIATLDPTVRVLALAKKGAEQRVIASSRSLAPWQGGKVIWLRGTCSNDVNANYSLPQPHDPRKYYPMESLARAVLQDFDYAITFAKTLPEQRNPAIMVHRSKNAFFFSGYCPDTNVDISLRFPLGAPLLIGYETFLQNGSSIFRLPRAWYHECRIFIEKQDGTGPIKCVEDTCRDIRYRRHLRVRGLNNATLYIFTYPGYEHKVKFLCDVERYDTDRNGKQITKEVTQTSWGPAWKCKNISGTLSFFTEL